MKDIPFFLRKRLGTHGNSSEPGICTFPFLLHESPYPGRAILERTDTHTHTQRDINKHGLHGMLVKPKCLKLLLLVTTLTDCSLYLGRLLAIHTGNRHLSSHRGTYWNVDSWVPGGGKPFASQAPHWWVGIQLCSSLTCSRDPERVSCLPLYESDWAPK